MMTSKEGALDLPMKALVYTGAGTCGKSVCVVINPATDRVTDVVIELMKPAGHQVMVPLKLIREVTEDGIEVDLTCDEIRKLPEFRRTDFYEVEVPAEFAGGPFVMWPYVVPEAHEVPVDTEMLPANELAIHRGAEVISTEGPVGKIDEFMIDPESEKVTHLVMREGHLWGQRDVVIPISAIARMDDDEVTVKLSRAEIEALPQIPVDREYHWRRGE
ncbi:MAG: PRC-barrel domain-containing protein [Anaerolineales bacterium]|jgi:sporulation protein YlmC with PRC-barrel domain